MKLHIDDRFLAVMCESREEEGFTKEFFTYKDMSKVFNGGKFNDRMIKNVCLAKKKNNVFITNSGFLREFIEAIRKAGIKIGEVQDKREKFDYMKKEWSREFLADFFPFDYNEHQIDAITELLKVNRGLVVAPTSAGKRTIFNAFIKITNLPTLILVNKITLANQLFEGAIEYGLKDVGIWHSKKRIKSSTLMIATIGSVGSLPSLSCYKMLIADEVHNASAKQYQDFFTSVCYPVQIGFSATPNKGDSYNYALIRRFLGSPIIKIKADVLIENKVMAKPKIHFIRNHVDSFDNWPDTMVEGLINNQDRNRLVAEILNKYNLPSLVLIADVVNKQGEKIKQAIEDNSDKRVVLLSGDTDPKDRDVAIKQLERNEIDVIIATTIFDEGVSIKNVHLYINASIGKSTNKVLQRIGRSLRMMNGKEQALVFDFMDLGNRFTENHSNIRRKLYLKEGYKDIVDIDI